MVALAWPGLAWPARRWKIVSTSNNPQASPHYHHHHPRRCDEPDPARSAFCRGVGPCNKQQQQQQQQQQTDAPLLGQGGSGWLVIASASPRAPVLCRGGALVGLPADGGGGWWVMVVAFWQMRSASRPPSEPGSVPRAGKESGEVVGRLSRLARSRSRRCWAFHVKIRSAGLRTCCLPFRGGGSRDLLAILGSSSPCVFGNAGVEKRANHAVGTELLPDSFCYSFNGGNNPSPAERLSEQPLARIEAGA